MNHTTTPNGLPGLDSFSDDAFIRLNELIDFKIIPFSKSTYWRKVKSLEFPPPEKISEQITATRVKHIREWVRDPSSYRVLDPPQLHRSVQPNSNSPTHRNQHGKATK